MEQKKKVIRVRHQKKPKLGLQIAWGGLIALTVIGVGVSLFPATLSRESIPNAFHTQYVALSSANVSTSYGLDRYKKPSPPLNGKRAIVIVVSDVGLQKSVTEKAVTLHPAITLAFSPYGDQLPSLMEALWNGGHELLMTLPLQPLSEDADRGPLTIAAEQTMEVNLKNLQALLNAGSSFIGVVAVEESQFMRFLPQMVEALKYIKANRLLFLEACPDYHTEAKTVSQKTELPYLPASLFLSSNLSPDAIKEKFETLDTMVTNSTPLVVVQATPLLVAKLGEWLHKNAKTVEVMPLSSLLVESNISVTMED